MDNFWPTFDKLLLTVACVSSFLNGFGIIYLIGKRRMDSYAMHLLTYDKIEQVANENRDD